MSPEQAWGQPLDARSDIFSFGVTLYEALAGYRPFQAATGLELLQSIIHAPPKPLPDTLPASLRAIVEKSLQKNVADRYPSMAEVTADLRRVARQTGEPVTIAPARKKSRSWFWMPALPLLSIALIATAVSLLRMRHESLAPTSPPKYEQLTNFADSATQPALSSDGRMMAFVHGPETFIGPGQIYVKFLPAGDAVQLTHDDMLKMAPRFTPDGTRIAYSTMNTTSGEFSTWIVPVLGGQEPRRLFANAEGLTWIQEKTERGIEPRVLFSEATGKGITLAVMSSTESRSDQRTVYLEDGIMDHFSYLSPDGKNLLLAEMGFNGWQACRLVSYGGGSKGRKVGPATAQCSSAAWSPDGKWMYFSADTGSGFHIWRQHFPNGELEQMTFGVTEEEGIELAPDGRSFLTSIGTRQSTLWIHDSRGDRQVTSEGYAFFPSFSRDNKSLYYLVRAEGDFAIPRGALWMMNLESGERQHLFPDYLMEHYSLSSDGVRLVFVAATAADRFGVWLTTLDGRSAPRRLADSKALQAYFGSSGEVLFAAQEPKGTFIYRVKEDGTGSTRVTVPHAVQFLYGVSPDGKSIAAWVNSGLTDETANAVGIYPLDGSAPTMICTTCGGRSPDEPGLVNWSADGKFIYLSFWRQGTYAIPLRMGQNLPPLPAGGIQSAQDAARLPESKPFSVAGAFPASNPSVYAYGKLSANRNIYRVPVR